MNTIKALSLILVAALMSVSVIGFSSVAAEEYNEKMYTLKELLEMSKEEYFEEFPEAEASFNEQKQFYEDEKENTKCLEVCGVILENGAIITGYILRFWL